MAIHISQGQDGRDLLLQDCALLFQPLCLQGSLLGFIKIMELHGNSTFYICLKPAIIAIILGAIFPLQKKSKTVRLEL
jgi:hypothetical protein